MRLQPVHDLPGATAAKPVESRDHRRRAHLPLIATPERILRTMFRTAGPSLSLIALTMIAADAGRAAPRPADRAALVTVLSDTGVPARTLSAKDFIVKEDGKKREVSGARLASDPLAVALVLDVAQPPRGAALPTQELRTAATAFVQTIHGVEPNAGIALWQF